MKSPIKKSVLVLALNIFIVIGVSAQQWTTDVAATNNIYNTSLLAGKVGIGIKPVLDGTLGGYPNLSPFLQIKGQSGNTGGTSVLFLPVVKISSTNYSKSLGFGFGSTGWPAVEHAKIYTEGSLKITSSDLVVEGSSYFISKVVLGSISTPGNYRLYVQGGILTEKIKVAVSTDAVNWSDFVFNSDYKLRSLSEVEKYVKANKHLPEIPSSEEVYRNGLDLVQMDAKLLMKIEELTLYMIELKKENEKLKVQVELLNEKIK